MRVQIVIVNYRTSDLVADCLRSLMPEVQAMPGLEVVIVDNDSGDGSAERLSELVEQQGWQAWARVEAQDHNGGFAFGNNVALRMGMAEPEPPDFFLLLNPDTFIYPGAVQTLVRFMGEHPKAGIAGSRLEEPDGAVQISAFRDPSVLSEFEAGLRFGPASRMLQRWRVSRPVQDQAAAVDWVSGASLMIRREVIESIGFMDEGYFLYYEEVDYCRKARRAGWECWHVPESRVVHLEGVATQIHARRKRRGRHWYDSRRRFFIKHYGIIGLALADLLWAAGRVTLHTRRLLGMGGDTERDPLKYAQDLVVGDLKAIVSGEAFRVRRKEMYA